MTPSVQIELLECRNGQLFPHFGIPDGRLREIRGRLAGHVRLKYPVPNSIRSGIFKNRRREADVREAKYGYTYISRGSCTFKPITASGATSATSACCKLSKNCCQTASSVNV